MQPRQQLFHCRPGNDDKADQRCQVDRLGGELPVGGDLQARDMPNESEEHVA